ncbi:MAG: AraC family transcriptional regulator [Steroidobacteraceae bacterium]
MSVSGAQTFSTSDVPPAVRLDRWVGFGCETLVHMSVDPADRASFRASITRVPVGPLGIAWMHTTPATARILARGPGAWAAPSRDVHLLVVQGRGSSRISLRGRSPTVLHYGDMILRDAFVPWTTETLEPTFLVMVKLPTGELRRRVGDPAELSGQLFSARSAPVRLAASIILSVQQLLEDEPGAEVGESVADIVLDALAMARSGAAGTAGAATAGPQVPARRREACDFIARHLADPSLTVGRIAAGVGLSTRQVQRLFLEIGTTPRRYLLERRLDAAARMLRRPGSGEPEAITDIAFEVGFNDAAYFSRAFARRYGRPPRAFRAGR